MRVIGINMLVLKGLQWSSATCHADHAAGAVCQLVKPPKRHLPLRSLFTALLITLTATVALAQDKVVYHFDNSDTQTTPGLRTLRHCMDGARDKKKPDIEYGAVISDLVAKGVKCEA